MRQLVPFFIVSSILLAACGKADPTKPIPWLQKPKDTRTSAGEGVASVAHMPSSAQETRAGRATLLPGVSGVCNIPGGYGEAVLADVLASPGAYADEKIQVAGWLGARWSFTGPAVEGVPVCQAVASYFVGESEPEGLFDEPGERVDIRGAEVVKVGSACASVEAPEAEVVVVWGRVSPSGDEVLIDGICAADELPCNVAAQCPAAMACGAAGLCELP